jgi:DNA-binding XRE family transcriptional regulator
MLNSTGAQAVEQEKEVLALLIEITKQTFEQLESHEPVFFPGAN